MKTGVAFVLACLPLLPAPALARDRVVEGKRVVVRSAVDRAATCERLVEVIERAIPVYEEHLPHRMPPEEKLVLRLYATAEEYAKAVQSAGAEQFASNLACTALKTRESYLVLQPRPDPAFLDLVGDLPEQTEWLACHEAAHQYILRAGVANWNLWPAWYSEGMAEYLAETCLRGALGKDGPTLMLTEERDSILSDALARDRMLSVERLLFADPATYHSITTLYSHCLGFYRTLASDAARLGKLHAAVARLPQAEPSAFARACAEALVEACGPLPALEDRWKKAARGKVTTWIQRIRASQVIEDELVCASFPGSRASVLLARRPSKEVLEIKGEVQILGLGQRQAELYLGFEQLEDPRFLSLALGSDGYVTLMAFSDGYWQPWHRANTDVPADTFAVGKWTPFQVSVTKDKVRLDVRGKKVFEAPVPPGFAPLKGAYGFGALDDVARYRNLEADGESLLR